MIYVCVHCRREVINLPVDDENPCWIDETGGEVCGWDGGNEPHNPFLQKNFNNRGSEDDSQDRTGQARKG